MKKPPQPRNLAPDLSAAPLAAAAASRGNPVWDPEVEAYLFPGEGVEYRLLVGPADERTGLLQVDGRLPDGEWRPLLRAAGMLFREEGGAVLPPSQAHQRCELQELRHFPRNRAVRLEYRESVDEEVLTRSVEVRLTGGTLEIQVQAKGGPSASRFCGFNLGEVGPEDARRIPVPGLPEPLVVLPGGEFAAAYVDRYRGAACSYPGGGAFYRPDTEGVMRDLSEIAYVTLSADPLEPLPALRRPTAPYRIALENRITLDFYSDAPYAEDERLLRLFQLYGLDDVLLIYRNWQQSGYGRRAPLMYPANPDRGTNEAFRSLIRTASEDGWLVALREEYGTVTRDSPYWSDKTVAQWWDGEPRQSRRPGHYGVVAERMLDFARLEATKIQRNYRPTAVFIDGHTAWSPETCFRQLDAAPNSASGTEALGVRHLQNLTSFLREVHEGPIVGAAGEGPARFDTFAEGLVEGVLRGPDGGASAPLIVDYELREVRPHLLGIGCGSYRQFCGNPTDEAVDAGRVDWDAYRATEIALGHTGYLGNYRMKPGARGIPFPCGGAATAVREYYLLRALQEQYVNAPVHSILYAVDDDVVDLAEALRRGADLSQARVRIEYGNGLTVWVNRALKGSWTIYNGSERLEVPPSGFFAVTPRQRVIAYSTQVNGQRTDFCRCPDYTFLDVRGTNARAVEGISTDGAVALLKSAVLNKHDVVLVGARQLTLGDDEYRLSERADLRLTHLSAREIELTVMDSESGKPVHVQWPAFSGSWRSDKLRVQELSEGKWEPSRSQVTQTRSGPQLARVKCGVTYRVALTGL